MFCRKNISKRCRCIFTISFLSPLGKEHGLSFEQAYPPLPKDALVEVGPVVLQENNVKFTLEDQQTCQN